MTDGRKRDEGMRDHGKFHKLKYLAGGVTGAAACSMLYMLPVLDEYETSEYSFVNGMQIFAKGLNGYGIVWSMLALFLAYFMHRTQTVRRENRMPQMKLLTLISVLFGILNTAGLFMHFMDGLPVGRGAAMLLLGILAAAGWALIFYHAAVWFLLGFEKNSGTCGWEISDRKLFRYSLLLILLFWLPWIIAYYPASMDNDVIFQLNTATGHMPKINHHPWFSSVVLASFYRVGLALGNENAGIFLYVLVRDLLIAAVFSRIIVFLKQAGSPKILVISAMLYYAVTPVWGAYAKHAFKDTAGTGLFCWFLLSLTLALTKEMRGADSPACWLETGLAGTFAALFRGNFIYAILPAVLCTGIYLGSRKKKARAGILIASTMLCFVYNQYIFRYEHVAKGSIVEALAIPMQQTARVAARERDRMTAQETEGLSKFWDLDELGEAYNPILFDPVKWAIHIQEGTDNREYAKIWISMFPNHKQAYAEALIAQNYGYYSFTPKRAYWEGGWNSNMTIFNWIGSQLPWKEYYDFHYTEAFEFPRQVLHNWASMWDKIPVLNLTDTIALYTWSIVLTGYYLLRKKSYIFLLPVFAVLLLITSCMAAPANDCFRYFAPAAASFPLVLALGFYRESDGDTVQ